MPLDPVLRDRLTLMEGISSWHETTSSPELRARAVAFSAPLGPYAPPAVSVEALSAQSEVPMRIYRPPRPARDRLAALVWLHGGGFVGGDLDMPESDYVATEIVHRANAAVVTVDYRLVNDRVHYPAPLEDVLAAWHWLCENYGRLGIDAKRVSLGGASAGANLAAAASLRLRDSDETLPQTVLLAYPALHPRLPPASPELAEKLAELDGLPEVLLTTSAQVEATGASYLGHAGPSVDPYAMPGLANLEGFPPTLVINSEYDPLRASGEAFAGQLAAVGAEVRCLYEPGTLHGHLNTIGLRGAERSLDTLSTVIRTGLIYGPAAVS